MERIAGARNATTIRIGAIDDWATRILPKLLAEFAEEEESRIELQTGLTRDLLLRLGSAFDLVVAMEPADAARGEVLRIERPVWAGTRRWDGPVPLALYPEGCLLRRWAIEVLDRRQVAWRCAYLSTSNAAVEAAAAAGLAVSVFKPSTLAANVARVSGLPELPQVAITLHVAPEASAAATRLAARLRRRRGR
jgi:DNA-binding transcriptional LysR family regulator